MKKKGYLRQSQSNSIKYGGKNVVRYFAPKPNPQRMSTSLQAKEIYHRVQNSNTEAMNREMDYPGFSYL